jgi:phage terminase large subunit-like protein
MLNPDELVAAAHFRLGLYGFLMGGHRPATHHQVIIDAVTDPTRKRVLIVMPPGHAKTTWGTVYGGAHYIGQHPDKSVLILSVANSRAVELMGAIKQQIEDPLYGLIFPDFRADKDRGWAKTFLYSTAAPKNRPDPTLACAGVGGQVIGRRPDLIIIDDPTDEDIATSPARRQSQETWFKRTLLTRATKDTKIVVIMTRWHEADLGGFITDPELTKELQGEPWEVIVLPAEAEPGLIQPPELFQKVYDGIPGRALWPDQYPNQLLADRKAALGPAVYRCVYQGDPSDLGGALYKLGNLTGYNPVWPERLRQAGKLDMFTYWDLAFSDDPAGGLNSDPDYTVGLTIGVDRMERHFVLDVDRFRSEDVEVIVDHMVTAAKRWQPRFVGIEQVAAQKLVVGLAKRRFRERFGPKAPPVIGVKVDRGKVERARLPEALTNPRPNPRDPDRLLPGKLRFNHHAPWWPKLRAELVGFPNAAHDDQSDALAGAVSLAKDHRRRVLNRIRVG